MKKNERGMVRKVLEFSEIHVFFKKLISGRNQNNEIIMELLPNRARGMRILDLGCGTAEILDSISGEKAYVGIDYNKKYIESASSKYKERITARFVCTDLNTYAKKCEEKFDLVLMIGVLHHVCDKDADLAINSVQELLADEGQFVSLDCCLTRPMNPIAWVLCKLDRGKYVRYKDEWVSLMKKHWDKVWYKIRTDTLVLPYSIILFKNMK